MQDFISGIDVSDWQGKIDWPAVASAGHDFAVVRSVVYGSRYQAAGQRDLRFMENWHGAKEAGLRVSAYYVHRPDLDAKMQVNNFLDAISGLQNDLPWVFDVELNGYGMSPGAITAHLWQCLTLFEAEYPKPIIYTGRWFWNPNILRDSKWKQYPLWTAAYTTHSIIPTDWKDWYIWQYTDQGRVPGIVGNVDLNWMQHTPNSELIFDIPESVVYNDLSINAVAVGKASGKITAESAWLQIPEGWVKVV